MYSSQTNLTGSCLCGAIRYQAETLRHTIGNCHCGMCRKFSGAAFSTFGEVPADKFRWTSGEHKLKTYVAQNGSKRQFCSDCGSSLTFAQARGGEDIVEFSLGTLDSELDCKPDAHIYLNYKADWFEVNDDLLQFAEGREPS
ncbi:GFA family protein [Arenicella xantha]|uniref:CENP-V/GFA domain-containing protein n=1 Tax=Arenicella xantha TaxID=644221 RepID=A0A395JEG1_9GAMM|nr:GFA family protein [Arenicella xantha]RBP47067.1 hypothetical protein DFR28_11030 [Arenicella xantha]